jgi:peptidyl-tRNA hydrolase, PTH1 family
LSALKKLIVGLGNPGKRYEQTRHNIGFMIVDELCRTLGGSFSADTKCALAKVQQEDKNLFFLKPLEFMNLSGNCVVSLSKKNGISPEHILVIHDEIDFPFGKVKLKVSGGHAGHNGLRDIIEKLGTNSFYRVRMGVGKPEDKSEVADYVLSRFSKDEAERFNEIYQLAESIIKSWLKT